MNGQERLDQLPRDRSVSYAAHYSRNGKGPYYDAIWTEEGKQQYLYLGKDNTGVLAERLRLQREHKWARRPEPLPCGHKKVKLNCEVCIRAVTWQMRTQQKGA